MTLLKSETAENASHYGQDIMQKEKREAGQKGVSAQNKESI